MNEAQMEATYIIGENDLLEPEETIEALPSTSRSSSLLDGAVVPQDTLPSITIEAVPNDHFSAADHETLDSVCQTTSISAEAPWSQNENLFIIDETVGTQSYFQSLDDEIPNFPSKMCGRSGISSDNNFCEKEIYLMPENSSNSLKSHISSSKQVNSIKIIQNSVPSKFSGKRSRNCGNQTYNLPKNPSILLDSGTLHSAASLSNQERIAVGKRKNFSCSKSNLFPALAPNGSTYNIGSNATIIDLKKIKANRDHSKPIQLGNVMVTIDDKDKVKVIECEGDRRGVTFTDFYGSPKKSQSKKKRLPETSSKLSVMKVKSSLASNLHVFKDDDDNEEEFFELSGADGNNEPSFQQFEDRNLLLAMENMRQLGIDCNVALIDANKDYIVYAHRLVLVARSPFFYRNLYVRRKKLNCLQQFCRFTLPQILSQEAVEAVVSFCYTDDMSILQQSDTNDVLRVLTLFEMKDVAEKLSADMGTQLLMQPSISEKMVIKEEPMEVEVEVKTAVVSRGTAEITARKDFTLEERRKRIKNSEGVRSIPSGATAPGFIINAAGEEVRMKPAVVKLVDTALNPFLCKLDELFDPSSTTMQVARTSQHVITLWNAEVLLTKLFDQNELTKYFTDYMNDIMEGASYDTENVSSSYGNYVVNTVTNLSGLDEMYTRVGGSDSLVPEVETLTVGNMQLINYTQMDPKHIPYFVRLISLYKFRIAIGNEKSENNRNINLIDPTSGQFQPVVQDFENTSINSDLNGLDKTKDEVVRQCIKKVGEDLSKKAISDLDFHLNSNYQEEMIMHIIVEQIEGERILPLCIGIFLAKGCSFCRKRDCSSEDLTASIGPNNPVCPDRQCIKRNLICQICNKQMNNSKSLMRHRYSVHDVQSGESGGLYICSHCGETFVKKWKLNVHEKQHEDKKLRIPCHICNKVMRGSSALKKHINMVHETKRQFQCEHCHKLFKRKETLLVHVRTHTGEKPFVCFHCDYSSETKGNLKAHTWRKHKRALLATSVGSNGIETSITGPITSDDGLVEETGFNHSDTDRVVEDGDAGTVLEGSVLELDETVATDGETHTIDASALVSHPHLQEGSFILS